jgi:hypothetical protein
MPAFSIVSDNGEVISSDKFKGKVILINFLLRGVLLVRRNLLRCNKHYAQVQRQ